MLQTLPNIRHSCIESLICIEIFKFWNMDAKTEGHGFMRAPLILFLFIAWVHEQYSKSENPCIVSYC